MAFFGLSVSANSTQEVAFPDGAMLSISQIALDEAKDGQTAIVQLQIAQEDFTAMEEEDEEPKAPETKTYTICKLTSGKVDQARVNLKLFSHEEAKISVKGHGTVHITGFLTPDPAFDDEDMDDEDEDEIEEALAKRKFGAMDDEEEDEDEMPDVKPPIKQQKTPQGASPSAPKAQPQQGGKPQGQQGGKPQVQQQGGKPQGQQGGKPQGGKPQGQQGGKPQGQQQGGKKNKGGKH